MKILTAGIVYFIAVFTVGFVLGAIRVLWLEPLLGKTFAVAIEAPFLLVAMVFAARTIPSRLGLSCDVKSLAAVGLIALLFQQIADLAVGIGLRDMSPLDQLRSLATPAGMIYAASLAAFAAMPLLLNRKS